MGPGARPRVAHEHEEFGRIFRCQQTLPVEGMHVALELLWIKITAVASFVVLQTTPTPITCPTTDLVLFTLGIVIFTIITTVFHPLAVERDDVGVKLDGVVAETDVDAGDLRLLAFGTFV